MNSATKTTFGPETAMHFPTRLVGYTFAVLLAACGSPVSGGGGGGTKKLLADVADSQVNETSPTTEETSVASDGSTCTPKCDGKSCTSNGCGGSCDGQPCDDGNACTSFEVCVGATCLPSGEMGCDDGNPCTIDACSPASGCKHGPASGISCSDNDNCTTGDVCNGQKCSGAPIACGDDNPCTADFCETGIGCKWVLIDDGESCGAGVCISSVCCVCPVGKSCNADGLCVGDESCAGKCGTYDKAASCQCDDQCDGAGDCCDDKTVVCSKCTPAKVKFCCAGNLCSYDSCYKKDGETPCVFGCDAKLGACKADPCSGYPPDGKCITKNMYGFCSVTTGNAAVESKLSFQVCDSWATCDDSLGFAYCKPLPASCVPGQAVCSPADTEKASVCGVDGKWADADCAGCVAASIANNVTCPGTLVLSTLSAKVSYEDVGPNAEFTAWSKSQPSKYPVIFAIVVVVRYSADFSITTVIDFASTAGDGTFSVKVPKVAIPTQDFVLLIAEGYDTKSATVRYMVANPTVPDGTATLSPDLPIVGKPYSWGTPLTALKANTDWLITVGQKSWALQIYDNVRYIYQNAAASLYGEVGKTLAVWVRDGTDWDCGACFSPWAAQGTKIGNFAPSNQIVLSTHDSKYFSDAVVAHEMGHWLMNSYGTSPGEGGQHFAQTKSPPGMAWSEGWATFFSSMARANSVYYDVGGGGMWWFDLATSKYDSGKFLLPFIDNPLIQFMDENRVSAILWQTADQTSEPLKSPANSAFWKALASNQMNDGTFTRGYKKMVYDKATPSATDPNGVTFTGLKQTNTLSSHAHRFPGRAALHRA